MVAMRRVNLKVDDDTMAAWVKAAHSELVTLSEWVRRACANRLEPGTNERYVGEAPAVDAKPQPAARREAQPPAGSRPAPAHDPEPTRAPAAPKGICPHRVRTGAYCKRCDTTIA